MQSQHGVGVRFDRFLAHAGAECAADHSRIHPGTDHNQLRGSRFARLPPQRRDPNMITHRLDLEFSCVTRNLEVHESFDAVHPRRLILEEMRQSPGIEWHLRREINRFVAVVQVIVVTRAVLVIVVVPLAQELVEAQLIARSGRGHLTGIEQQSRVYP